MTGSSSRRSTRTRPTSLPNLSGILFPLIYSGFRRFLICFTYSLTLLSPLFPSVPAPSVVIYVVKNASRPILGEHSPVPDGKRFAFLCGLYCNSEGRVMQVISAKAAAQMLSRNNQRAASIFFLYFLAFFSGFLSILIPFLTSCAPHPPWVPHLSVAFYVVKSKASPELLR